VTQEVERPVELGPAASARQSRRAPWVGRRDLYAGGWIIGSLAVVGALLGLVWQAVSPRTLGLVLQSGAIIPDETEGYIGADGWFALLTGLAGLVVAIAVWTRREWRGPAAVAALAIGSVIGALATEQVGRLAGGGHAGGSAGAVVILPISVHARGLFFLEAAAAVFVYGLLVAFTGRDDLGRTDASEPDEPASARPPDADSAGGWGPETPVSSPPE
jgi:Protein of unknown function (DUF2567)